MSNIYRRWHTFRFLMRTLDKLRVIKEFHIDRQAMVEFCKRRQ